MKLTILGGGGFRVPLVFKALAHDTSPQRVTELRLYDTDPLRLGVIETAVTPPPRAPPPHQTIDGHVCSRKW